MFETAGAKFNDDTGFYELNGLTDITEREMCDIYQEGPFVVSPNRPYNQHIRTNIVRIQHEWSTFSGMCLWRHQKIEVVNLSYFACTFTQLHEFVYDCPKLRRITGFIQILSLWSTTGENFIFRKCPNLEFIGLYKPECDLPLGDCPKLNLETFQQLIKHPSGKPVVITVHPDVYAKLTDPNNVEWSHIVPDAQAKQITFATV